MRAISEQALSQTKRILLVDDHAIVRDSLRILLEKIPGIKVIGEAATGWLGVKLARELQPELIILDFNLPDISGLEVTQRLLKTCPQIRILVLSAETHPSAPTWLLTAGAHGYLNKSASPAELRRALEIILEEQQPFNLENPLQSAKNSCFDNLSNREIEITRMILRGNTTNAIAQQLHIDLKTVYAYRWNIFRKLNIKNSVALVLLALRKGILAPEDV